LCLPLSILYTGVDFCVIVEADRDSSDDTILDSRCSPGCNDIAIELYIDDGADVRDGASSPASNASFLIEEV
jgi:hypothetical protein